MAKMKIFELKNLINEQTNGNIESKAILDYLEKTTGVKKTHSSNLEDNEVSLLKSHFVQQTSKAVQKPAQPAGQSAAKASSEQKPVQPMGQSAAKTEQRPAGQPASKVNSEPRAAATQGSTHRPEGLTRPVQTAGRPEAGQKPAGQNGPAVQGQAVTGYQGTQGSYHTGPRPSAAGRPEAGQRPMGQNGPASVGYQGTQGSYHTGPRPNTAGRPEAGQRPMGQGGVRQSAPGHAGAGYQGTQGGYHTGQRPEGAQRPMGQGGMRQGTQAVPGQNAHGYQGPQGSYHTGPRPDGVVRSGEDAGRGNSAQLSGRNDNLNRAESGQKPAGQGGVRQGADTVQRTELGQRPVGGQSGQGYQGGQRQEGQLNQMQQRTSGQGSQGGSQRPEAGQRPDSAPRTDAGQRPAGQGNMRQGSYNQGNQGYSRSNQDQSQRSSGNESGQRSGYRQQNQGQGYQRSEGGQGYQRSEGGQGRSSGSDQGYQRQQGGYRQTNPNSPNQGRQGGYAGGRDRAQGSGYNQGGSGYNSRPSGSGYNQGGGRPAGQGGYSKPGSGPRPGGGFGSRGMDEFKKDEDDRPSFNRAGQGKRPVGQRGGERKNFDQQILDQKVAEKNDFSNKRNRDRINKEKTYKEKSLIDRDELESEGNNIKKIVPKKGQFIQPKPVAETKEDEIKTIVIPEVLTIKELADKMKMPSSALVKKLFLAGKMVSINQEITFEEAEGIALDYEIIAEKEVKVNEIEELLKETEDAPETLEKRPPVVCVMGHVDHGKTSLLDAIRETNVTSREAGGITQHIGAYVVEINGEKITFLDTPGHEAFTSMRLRGAKSTDIAILVVAADDGVMPQTIEAISHAKAAGVQIIVAVNKIDKPSANVERVKQELTEYELVAEDWGGDTIFVPVSAHTKEGIDHLLEMILLTAEMIELKANRNRNARGIVIEAELDKGRGPVATVLVQKGTLKVGDNIVVGASFGKVRAMMDDKGRRVKEATPSTPVEILGLNEVPDAGETFLATDNEKEARTIADAFISRGKEKLIADTKAKLSLDGLFSQIKAGNIKEFNLIIKADVQGSVEAMKQSLVKLSNDEVAVRIIHGGVGAINESDVMLASTSNAIIIGFNVRPDNAAKETAERENVDVKLYRVIYNAIDDIEAAMKGLLDPVFEERIIGHAEIRQTFKASGVGTIAGSYVIDGKIIRASKARIYRDNALIYEGTLASLKRFQDDVKEVATGYECGLVFDKFNDVKEGDKVELYIMQEVPR